MCVRLLSNEYGHFDLSGLFRRHLLSFDWSNIGNSLPIGQLLHRWIGTDWYMRIGSILAHFFECMLELSCGDLCGGNRNERVCELPGGNVSDRDWLIELLQLSHRLVSVNDWCITCLELFKLCGWHLRVSCWHQRLLELFIRNISREYRRCELLDVFCRLLLGLGCEHVFEL